MIKIYFDMDGVLADFEGYYHDNGIPFDFDDHEEESWDVVRNTPNFYYVLKPIKGALELFKKFSESYDCIILSAKPKPFRGVPTAEEDKINWLIKYLGQEVADKANICYREDKEKFCTGSQDILVDDYEINIEEWTKKGGTGVLFKDAESAEKQLNDILSKMIVS